MTSIDHINRIKKEKQLCEQFNEMYPVGTVVMYWTGVREGNPSGTGKTRSEAEMLGGHTAVVWVEGKGSCISLSHIEVV